MRDIGRIKGSLRIVVGDADIDLGYVSLPLSLLKVKPDTTSYLHLGLGVDLEEVRDTIAEIFKQGETE